MQLGSPSPGESPSGLPGGAAPAEADSVSVVQHVAYGDSRALPPFAAGLAPEDEALDDADDRVEFADVREEVSRGALRRSSAQVDAVPSSRVLETADAAPTADLAPTAAAVRTADLAPDRDDEPGHNGTEQERAVMAHLEQAVQDLLAIDGATGVAIVDSGSGMALAHGGYPGFDLEIAAAGNSNVVRAKLQTMAQLGLSGRIDDILITLDEQYHLINVLNGDGKDGLFVYLVLDRAKANLALARHKLTGIAGQLEI